jgi:hypothetical protein
VGITPLSPSARPSPGQPPSHLTAFVTGGAYALLLLLGLLEGVIGSFQYSRGAAGSVPLGSIGFALLILVTCGLAGWAMRGMPGALLPAIGWFVASFGLAMPNAGGSVIIANTSAGEWFLYGGSVCALVGVGSAFVTVARRPLGEPRSRGATSGPGRGNSQPRRGWLKDRNRTANGDVPPA